jgi:hypothetical protein
MTSPYRLIEGVFDHSTRVEGKAAPAFSDNVACFGLSNRAESNRWQIVQSHLDENPDCKLLIIGRHGQGVHNLGQLKYGAVKWQS